MGSLLTLHAGATGLVYPLVVVLMLGLRAVEMPVGVADADVILARGVRWWGWGLIMCD